MKSVSKFLMIAAIPVAIASCSPQDIPNPLPPVTSGVYVLNEGNFNGNNTTLTYYDFATSAAATDFYQSANGNGLGDTGNDLLLYGGKMYIVMNVSGYIEVANAFTAKSIAKIDMKNNGTNRQPRYAVPYQNKVFITSYDGTVAVLDTASLTITKFISVGANPEQMTIVGNKLYVANSGGLTASFDSTVSVIDLATMTELNKITVGKNPGAIAADNAGNIYVACGGNYNNIRPSLVKVSTSNNSILKSADTTVGKIRFYDGYLYATGGYSGSSHLRKLSTTDFSQQAANFVTDGTTIMNPYGVNINADNGDVYITDAKDFSSPGAVFCFDNNGKKKFSFSIAPGKNPNTVAFIKR